MIRVVVTGYTGRVGSVVYKYLQNQSDIEVIAGFNSSNYKGLAEVVKADRPHFLVDFTLPDASMDIIREATSLGVNVLTGTTGFPEGVEEEFQRLAKERDVLIAWVPNFSIGANLMLSFAEEASKYFDEAEIVEMHHRAKRDKPSGTAKFTASLIESTWRERGLSEAVNVSSLRLSSAVAHQWVLFSGEDEFLVIEHHSLSRVPFAKGVLVALRRLYPKLSKLRGRFLKGMREIMAL